MKTDVKQKATSILKTLEAHGYEAYFVGGYVRDQFAGRPNSDIDIATSAKPPEVMAVFPRTVPTGLKHGTVTVIEQGIPFEVTTFRTESEYEQHRRPKEVRFVSNLEEDLKRRDFTINAMAMDVKGQLIDPFAGRADLEKRVLRCVGHAEERFQEDALRMVRCIRFAAEYELDIDEVTWEALLRLNPLIAHIAMERIRMELERIIEGRHPMRGLSLLTQSELLFHLKADLPWTKEEWSVALRYVEPVSRIDDADTRWFHLLWSLGITQEECRAVLRKLTFSNERLSAITQLIALTEYWASTGDADEPEAIRQAWIRSVIRFGDSLCGKWLHWLKLCQTERSLLQELSISPQVVALLTQFGTEWTEKMPARSLRDLNVDGKVLQTSLPGASGPKLGHLLRQLLLEAALGHVPNVQKELLGRASELLAARE